MGRSGKVDNAMTSVMIDRIQKRREAGENVIAPWKMTWDPKLGMPRNLLSGKAYRGINVWMTLAGGFGSPFFFTRKQIGSIGGKIKTLTDGTMRTLRGGAEVPAEEPYTPIHFWWFPTPEERAAGRFAFCKFYQVWNVEQASGIENHPNLVIGDGVPFDPIADAEALVKGYTGGPEIRHGGGRACYVPSADRVDMPDREAFTSSHEYYRVLFHELTHSTGHRTRLERDGVANPASFASHAYSEEELIAEMGATMLAGFAGIASEEADENSAAYLDHWLSKLKADPNLLVSAGGAAQKAVDHVRNIKWEKAETPKPQVKSMYAGTVRRSKGKVASG